MVAYRDLSLYFVINHTYYVRNNTNISVSRETWRPSGGIVFSALLVFGLPALFQSTHHAPLYLVPLEQLAASGFVFSGAEPLYQR